MVELTERLIGKGYDLQRLRPQRAASPRSHGANRDYILNQHPAHLAPDGADRSTRCSAHAETIVIGNGAPEFARRAAAASATARR